MEMAVLAGFGSIDARKSLVTLAARLWAAPVSGPRQNGAEGCILNAHRLRLYELSPTA
jgi:hypothetical protein